MAPRELSRRPSRSSAPQATFAGSARAELFLSNVHWFACRYDDFAAAAARAEQYYAESGFSPALPLAIQAEALYYGAVPVGDALAHLRGASGTEPAIARHVQLRPPSSGALRAVEGDIEDGQLLLDARPLALRGDRQRARGADDLVAAVRRGRSARREPRRRESALPSEHRPASVDARRASRMRAHRPRCSPTSCSTGARPTKRTRMRGLQRTRRCRPTCSCSSSGAARARACSRGRATTAEAEEIARDAVRIASLTDGLRDRARAHFALAEVLHLGGKAETHAPRRPCGRRLLRQKGATALLERHRTPLPAHS